MNPLATMALIALLSCADKGGDGASPRDTDTAQAADSGAADDTPDWGAPEPWAGEPVVTLDGPPPRNIIFLSVDTLQVDRVGRYSGLDTTPFLDSILEQSLVLDKHRSCSNWTYTSIICIYGGRDAMDADHVPMGRGVPIPVPEEQRMIGEWLSERGYRSLVVTANPFMSADWGTTDKLDRVLVETGADAPTVTAAGLENLDELTASGEPWFLQLHYYDPHSPYAPPDEYLTELEGLEEPPYDLTKTEAINAMKREWLTLDPELRELLTEHLNIRYNAALRYWDDQLRVAWGELESRGLLDDAVVVIWSDHGEQIYERGDKLGHGIALYDLEHAAIAAFWSPRLQPVAWAGPTTHRDLLPTLWSVMGWEMEPEFTGVPAGAADPARQVFGITYQESITQQSVTVSDWKLIYEWTGRLELYDELADPTERDDRARYEPERRAELWNILRPYAWRLYEEFYPDGPAPVEP